MLRMVLWTLLYVCTLGALTIKVEYSDGLKINFKGWL
jgi:hypothetical protein